MNRRYLTLQNQIMRLNGRLALLQQRSSRLSQLRLLLFFAGAVVSGILFLSFGPTVWLLSLLPALLPFVVAVAIHRRVQVGIIRLTIWRDLKQAHVARMGLDWAAIPPTLPVPSPFEHPFALDIDLIGEHSIHRLLDTAVSAEGSRRLRDWLINTDPQLEVIERRQAQVRDLLSQRQFRDKLTLNGMLVSGSKKWPGQQMLDWLAEGTDGAHLRPLLIQLSMLAALSIPLFVLNMAGLIGIWWLIPWSIYGLLFVVKGGEQIGTLFRDATFLADGLRTLNGVFGFLENGRYQKMPHIRHVVAPFLDSAERPSQHIRRVTRMLTGVGLRQNPMLGLLINMVVPWDIYFAYRLHQCRTDLAERLPVWMDCWFELEALSALATFADLNPGHVTFPTVWADANERSCLFDAQGVGHPLIVSDSRVCNDFQMPDVGAIALVTGSNMAGKSSFLRTVGVNLALAYAGGAVMAQSLHTRLLRLASSMRVSDSVVDGFSFFYAEVRRLQSILAALHETDERPLCFLIDEIFRGTNNRERLIGSRAYIRALAKGHGVGIIATHDLELVQLEDEIPSLRNMHFRDDVENGRMVFDYQLHAGPCPTTNALKIMRQAGLPVEGGGMKDEG